MLRWLSVILHHDVIHSRVDLLFHTLSLLHFTIAKFYHDHDNNYCFF